MPTCLARSVSSLVTVAAALALALALSGRLAATAIFADPPAAATPPDWAKKIPGTPQTRFVFSEPADDAVTAADVADIERRIAAAGDVTVGQVDGRAIGAADVLRPRARRLAAVAALDLPPAEAESRVTAIVQDSLRQILQDALLTADARNALTDEERAALAAWMEEHGADLNAQGREQMLRHLRMRQLLGDQLDVDVADVRRFHARHIDWYTVPTERTVRMIKAADEAAAERIDAALRDGVPFAVVAATDDNAYRRSERGLIYGPLIGHDTLVAPLNEALLRLETGQHSARIDLGGGATWIALVEIVPGRIVPVEEARESIEREIRSARQTAIVGDHMKDLLEHTEHTPLGVMVEKTMRVVRAMMD